MTMLTVKQLAAILSLHPMTVYKMVKDGKITVMKGVQRSLRFDPYVIAKELGVSHEIFIALSDSQEVQGQEQASIVEQV